MGDAPAGGPQPDPELYTPRAQMRRRLSRALPAVVCALAWTAMSSAAILVNKHIMVRARYVLYDPLLDTYVLASSSHYQFVSMPLDACSHTLEHCYARRLAHVSTLVCMCT